MNTFWRNLSNKQGVTIVEVLISAFVLSIGITGSLAYFTTAQAATQVSRHKTVATAHAEYVLEEMSALAALTDITQCAIEEETCEVEPYELYWDAFVAAQNLDSLLNEDINVNLGGDLRADPLPITITVSWDVGASTRSISLTTELTKWD